MSKLLRPHLFSVCCFSLDFHGTLGLSVLEEERFWFWFSGFESTVFHIMFCWWMEFQEIMKLAVKLTTQTSNVPEILPIRSSNLPSSSFPWLGLHCTWQIWCKKCLKHCLLQGGGQVPSSDYRTVRRQRKNLALRTPGERDVIKLIYISRSSLKTQKVSHLTQKMLQKDSILSLWIWYP